MTHPKTWTLVLNEYQRNNLLLLLNACGYPYGNPHVVDGLPHFDTGDWLGEVTNMLGGTLEPGAQTNTTAQRWRDEIRAAASAAAAAPQVVDRDGVLEEVRKALRAVKPGSEDDHAYRAGFGDALSAALQLTRALKAPPPPAAAPRGACEKFRRVDDGLSQQVCGRPMPCPEHTTPSAPPPTGERTAGPTRTPCQHGHFTCHPCGWLVGFPEEIAQDAAGPGDHIGSSRSPAGTGKEGDRG